MRLVLGMLFCCFTSTAAPQPDTTVDEALARLHAAYLPAADRPPIGERLALEIVGATGMPQSTSAEIRVGWDEGPVLALSLDAFRAHASAQVVRVEREGLTSSRLLFERPSAGNEPKRGILESMPLGAMPQLWGLAAEGVVIDPLLGRLIFDRVEHAEGSDHLRVTGRSPAGPAVITLHATSGRVIAFEADARDGRVRLRAFPIDPPAVETWRIQRMGRRIVTRLDQLVIRGEPYGPGSILPDLPVRTASAPEQPFSLGDWLDDRPAGGPAVGWTVVLFVIGPAASDATIAGVRSSLSAAAGRRRAEANDAERYWLRYRLRPVVIVDAPQPAVTVSTPNISEDVVVTTDVSQTIDRMPVGASAWVVAIDRDRVIGAVGAVGDDDGWSERFVDTMVRSGMGDAGERGD